MVWVQVHRGLALFLIIQLATSFSLLTDLQAKTPNQTTSTPKKFKVTFDPPPNQPAPKVTIGGGRRDNDRCPEDRKNLNQPLVNKTTDQLLTPLLPPARLGLTVSPHPTFMVYVPQSSTSSVVFTLENQQGEGIYQKKLDFKGTPGIISFSLPTTEPPLEIGKDYKWVVSMVCELPGPKDPFAEGVVRRIQPNSLLASQLNKAQSLDGVVLYAKSGIWQEAAAALAALRRSQPQNAELTAAWKDLLQSIGLDAISSAPLKN
ncbi:DUF928 domain-containing protein [Iningainema tapete]|uniref:DUF928 domain-containing protein n=1 Tax=Iningainema tapete BLCC-T55 TaxID=2748662 RepID=A0A8J7CCS7_9CYAN|nr:DUF928 domain-containing protein [Iningainema tapete]MBD2772425.1 DUF928 domain-containing protein [Iningainema tapete BLCC-T55]